MVISMFSPLHCCPFSYLVLWKNFVNVAFEIQPLAWILFSLLFGSREIPSLTRGKGKEEDLSMEPGTLPLPDHCPY